MMDMNSNFLTDYISSCQAVADCRLISKDGKEFWAHRIVLGARSEFFKDILATISDTGHAAIILPDHDDEEVEAIRNEIISLDKKLTEEDLNELLFIVDNASNYKSNKTCEDDYCNKEIENNGDQPLQEEDIPTSFVNRTEISALKDKEKETFELKPEYKLEDQIKVEKPLDTKKNLYKEAIESYFGGKFSSLYQVSKYYNLPYTTLYGVVVHRGSYRGKGRKGSLFSIEEENEIASMIINKAKDGMKVTWKVLKEMLEKQIEEMMVFDPSRETFRVSATKGGLVDMHFVRRFAARNNLMQYIFVQENKSSKFECKECKKLFSFKNALVKHEKTVHKFEKPMFFTE